MKIGRRRAAESWRFSANLSFSVDSIESCSLAITLFPEFVLYFFML